MWNCEGSDVIMLSCLSLILRLRRRSRGLWTSASRRYHGGWLDSDGGKRRRSPRAAENPNRFDTAQRWHLRNHLSPLFVGRCYNRTRGTVYARTSALVQWMFFESSRSYAAGEKKNSDEFTAWCRKIKKMLFLHTYVHSVGAEMIIRTTRRL